MAKHNIDIDEKIREWMDGELSDQEWDEVKRQVEDPEALARIEQIVERSEQFIVPKSMGTDEAWALLEDKLEEDKDDSEEEGSKVIPISIWQRRSIKVGVAASVLILVSFFVFRILNTPEMIVAEPGSRLTYTLPDGSTVELNAGSTLTYSKANWDKQRKVTLKGEAFFEVAKGSTFTVNSALGSVTVLGTKFNVKTKIGKFEVACTEGKVRVASKEGQSVTLTAGLATKLENGKLTEASDFNSRQKLGWRTGVFVYNDTPLWEVFVEIEDQFGVEIAYGLDVKDRPYTGFFDTSTDLDAAMESVLVPMGLSYDVKDGTILIK
ncbi:MAG: FecR domain-containing protein [Bacteroidota bacterium]